MLQVHGWCYDSREARRNLRRLWWAEKRRIVRKRTLLKHKHEAKNPRVVQLLLQTLVQTHYRRSHHGWSYWRDDLQWRAITFMSMYFHYHHKLIHLFTSVVFHQIQLSDVEAASRQTMTKTKGQQWVIRSNLDEINHDCEGRREFTTCSEIQIFIFSSRRLREGISSFRMLMFPSLS